MQSENEILMTAFIGKTISWSEGERETHTHRAEYFALSWRVPAVPIIRGHIYRLKMPHRTSASINTPPRNQVYGVDVQLPLSTKLKGNSYTVSNYINSQSYVILPASLIMRKLNFLLWPAVV
jgi:hypothetical protein